MKLDSESPYQCTCPHEHDTKVIVHNDKPFILAKDNHFMIGMLNIDKETLKEGKHGLTLPIERKSSKVTNPPNRYSNLEDSINRNKSGDESMEALHSAPSSGFEMVVKEDFYTDKITTKVELPEMKVLIEDDPCHIVEDISIDKGLQSSDRNLVEKDVGLMEPSISNQTLDNEKVDSTSAMVGSSGVDDSKYIVFSSPLNIVDKYQADPASVLHNDFDVKGSSLGSFDSGGKLDMISNTSAKVIEIPEDQASVFDNDPKGKSSSVSSVNIDGNLDANESLVSNTSAEFTETQAVPASDVHSECDGKVSSVSSIDCADKLDNSESVASNIAAEVTEIPAVPAFDAYNECAGRGSLGSIDCGGKLGTSESIAGTISSELTRIQLPPSQEILLQVDPTSLVFSTDQKQSADGEKYKDISEESNSASTVLSLMSEISVLSNGSKEIPADCKVPTGVITFSFETEATSTSGRDETKETINSQQSEAATNGSGMEEAVIDGTAATARCSFLQLIQGESNFSGPDILSGPIANSGHISYSGSISLRSDSSTTSARSFAFPILQSEWNSSPVKMAKADRRHLRKHRGWRMGLLCCRF